MGGAGDLEVIQKFEKLPLPGKLLTAGASACIADFLSFPLDTAKVRLQVQVKAAPISTPSAVPGGAPTVVQPAQTYYKGIFGTIGTIAKEEGVRGLFKGLNAGLQRQFVFASVRLGMYESVKTFYQGLLKIDEKSKGGAMDVTARIFAGLTTGGMAVTIGQPTDVVKIRFQADARAAKPRYTGTWNAYKTIFRTEGLVSGLWRGVIPNIGRNATINVAEIVCYDIVKDSFIRHGIFGDTIYNHFSSATVAGFCATFVASPIDVIKTRYMNSPEGKYRGAIDCAIKTLKTEGTSAFYKGFWPSFSRLVSFNIIMWVTYEQARKVVVANFVKDDNN